MASVDNERSMWQRVVIRLVAVGFLGVILWSVAGIEALVLVPIVAGLWIVTPTTYTFASGQLLAVVLLAPVVESPLVVAAFGVLFLAIFLATWPLTTAVLSTVVFGLAWVGLASARMVDPLWVGAVGMLLAFALLSYGIHRYELVTLGLVPREDEAA